MDEAGFSLMQSNVSEKIILKMQDREKVHVHVIEEITANWLRNSSVVVSATECRKTQKV